MEVSDVAVATITWARTADDEALLTRSLRALVRHGCPVAIADRGASATFSRVLADLPAHVTVAASGLVPQVRAALDAAVATGRPWILYTEPDKHEFFESGLAQFVASANDAPDVGAIAAARSEPALATFPPFQRYTETVVNRLCAERLGIAGDFCFGPFLLRAALVPRLEAMGDDLGWGWRPFAFRTAVRDGGRLAIVEGDHECPPAQRHEGEPDRLHRMRQLAENVRGLLA